MGTPGYQIVIDYVTARISAGEWKPGARLPTIVELADLTDTSRTTVKVALAVLHDRGTVRGQQGKGNFVAG